MEKQQKKIIAIGAILVGFAGISFFGYKQFVPRKPSATVEVHPDTLNTRLPALQQPVQPLTKMEIYLQAEKDSVEKLQARARDPYSGRNNPGKDIVKPDPVPDRHFDKLYAEIDKAMQAGARFKKNNVKKVVDQPDTFLPASEITADQTAKHKTSGAQFADPELQQLSGMLDKLSELQNPSPKKVFRDIDSAIAVSSVTGGTIQAVVHKDQVITNGGILKLRLSQDIVVNGTRVTRGSFVYGVCSISNERLMVQLSHIAFRGSVLPFPLLVYDLDGMEGIYIPGAVSRETGKEGMDNLAQSFQFGGLEQGFGAQAASAGLQTAKNLFSRKVRAVRVTAKAGHRVYLQKSSLSSQ